MTIEKLPSGSYRIKKMYNRKMYSVTIDHKPTQKEAMELLTEQFNKASRPADRRTMTFSDAYDAYLDLKSNILSPSTKRGYKSVMNNIPYYFKQKRIYDIDDVDVQKVINDYSADHSPKSTRNVYGLISIVLKTYVKDINLSIQLPQKVKIEPYIPSDEEVKAIIAEIKDSRYYIPTVLAALGMRKSEICALTISDLTDDNRILISKALVRDEKGNNVIKTTKTTESTREIFIPSDVADRIRQQGYVYKGFPDSITRNLKRIQDKLGIENFPLHKMRHFFASYAHNELHLSDKQIMEAGGWKTNEVMKTVYMHAMKQEEAKKKIANQMGNLF